MNRKRTLENVNIPLMIDRIEKLCDERHLKPTTVYNVTGVGRSFKTNLIHSKSANLKKIAKLAEYFNVSVEYLIGQSDERTPFTTSAPSSNINPLGLTVDEQYLLDTYHNWCHTYEDHRRLLNVCDQLRAENALRNETTV